MSLIDKASRSVASRIAAALNLDKDREEVLEYGALNLFHTLFSLLMLILFGLLTDTFYEILIISTTAALLRQYSGGAHATSSMRCSVITVITFGGLSLIAKYGFPIKSLLGIGAFQALSLLIVLVLFYKYAPVDSPNKRITNPDRRLRLKKASLKGSLLLALSTVALWMVYFNTHAWFAIQFIICIHIGMAWQAVSITNPVYNLIESLDKHLSVKGKEVQKHE